MLKKVVTYINVDDVEQTDTLWFHMTKAEIVKAFAKEDGDLMDRWSSAIRSDNKLQFVEMFDEMIQLAVGVRDHKTNEFYKPKDYGNRFITTEAYSALFMDMMSDVEKATRFFLELFPKAIVDQVREEVLKDAQAAADRIGVSVEVMEQSLDLLPPATSVVEASAAVEDTRPTWVRENREPTQQELISMPREELVKLMQSKTRS